MTVQVLMEGVDVNVYPPDPGWGQDPRESLDELARELMAEVERRQAAKKSSQPAAEVEQAGQRGGVVGQGAGGEDLAGGGPILGTERTSRRA